VALVAKKVWFNANPAISLLRAFEVGFSVTE